MASSRRRSRLPGARLWLGLLLVAGWSTVGAGSGSADRDGPDAPLGGGPEVAPPPPTPPPARRVRPRGPGLTLPLPRGDAGAAKPATDPDETPSLRPLPGDRAEGSDTSPDKAALPPEVDLAGPPVVLASLADADVPVPAPPLAVATLADADVPSPAPPVALSAPPVRRSYAPAAKELIPPQGRPLHRDPVEPPVTPLGAWREMVLSVVLNGKPVSQGTLFAEDPRDGRLAIELATLQLWRVATDVGDVLTFEGEPYYPLDRIAGAIWKLDRQNLAISLELPPERFTGTLISEAKGPAVPPATGRGAFLDYDFLASAGDDVHARLDGLTELGAFFDYGTVTTSAKLSDLASSRPGVTRLDTTYSRDLPDRQATFRLGDSVTGGGAFAFPVRFAGVQYGTNFGTDPAFVPFPLPSIGGLARQESAVDLLIDDLERVKSNVPAGPFSISNLPVVTGSGEMQLRVTDLLGRQQVVTQSYYVSSRLLKPGLQDFSYEAGVERERYGEDSFRYGSPLAAATERYGFTDHFTGEAHVEAEPDRQSLAAGGSYLLGRWGVVTTGAGVSQHHAEAGGMVEVGYEYEGRRFNFGARTRAQTPGFAQIGGDDGVTRTDQLNLGFDLGPVGSLGFLVLNREADRRDDVTTAVASYSHPLGPGLVSLRAAELFRPESDLTVTAAYVLPLGTTRTVATEVESRDGDVRGRVQYHQSRGASDLGLDYRLGADIGATDPSVDARVSYQTRLGAAEVDAEQVGGSTRVQGDLNGSVTLLDGHVGLSRQVGRAFGLVALPGYPNVRVYVDNREVGRTDKTGYLLLPDLRPYEANKVRLAVDDLPLDAQLRGNEVTAVPYDGNGVLIGFRLDHKTAATVVLRDADGRPLPAGLGLASADGAVTVQVAKQGFAQVDGFTTAPVRVSGASGSHSYACDLSPPPAGELLPDLGEVTCR